MSYIENTIAVLCGGAAGAVCRFKLNAAIMSGLTMTFPLGILCINVLGGFTTFSTFSLDTFNLYHTGDLMLASLNILLNAVICICAVWAGYRIVFPRTAAA